MPLDKNKTIHQRIAGLLQPVLGFEDAERIAKLMRPYVVAERLDAVRLAMRPDHADRQSAQERYGDKPRPALAPKRTDFPLCG